MNMKIGFTGTQCGTTDPQLEMLIEIIEGLEITKAGHGDCVGADGDFHIVLRTVAPHVKITGHIPVDQSKREFCDFDTERDPCPFLVRNRHIVDDADLMIGCPEQKYNKEILRSGTWATIRYARKQNVPLIIIWADGICTFEP